MTKRVTAYAMLAHHALNELFTDSGGCCPRCCAPCGALKILDGEGILDALVLEWYEYEDGTRVFENPPEWFKNGHVDRGWMYSQWSLGEATLECHNAE